MATAGNVDLTFGTNGLYTSAAVSTAYQSGLTAVAVGSDGTIFAAGSVTPSSTPTLGVISLTSAGQPNPNFGTDGVATIPVPTGTLYSNLSAIAVTTGGQVLVGGSVTVPSGTSTTSEGIIAEFNADGTLDTAYGTNGEVILGAGGVSFGGVAVASAGFGDFLAFQADGSAVFTGSVPATGGGSTNQAAVARLSPQGVPDTTFGTGGLVVLPAGLTSGSAVAVETSGQILVAGETDTTGETATGFTATDYIYRLSSSGAIDPTLSNPIFSTGIGIAQVYGEADGHILVAGITPEPFVFYGDLVRLNADGSSDGAYSTGSQNSAFAPTVVGEQANGQILIQTPYPGTSAYLGAGISRLTASLTVDSSFGSNGVVSFIHNPDPTVLSAATIAPDGSIIAVGNTTSGSAPSTTTADSVVQLNPNPTPATPGDFSGDGVSDPAVYLTGTGTFVIGNSSGGAGQVVQLGSPGLGNSIPAPADYYGNGQEDLAVYLVQQGVYAIKDPTGQTPGLELPFGIAGTGQTIPVPGDYYGVGFDQVAIFLTGSATWDILNPSLGSGLVFPFGVAGVGNTIPVPGDYYGNGQSDVAVYLPQTATWDILTPGLSQGFTVQFGIPGAGNAIPVPGDYDGSGRTELAVYLPSLGELQYINGSGSVQTISFGIPGPGQTLPEPGDYDGSGKTEVAAYLPSLNVFAYRPANGGADVSFKVGFTSQGPIVPVTPVVPSDLLMVFEPGLADAIEAPGEADALDFLMPLASDAKKGKPGETSTN